MKPPKRILVVGGNAAGAAAAAKAKRTMPSAEIMLIERSGFMSTATCLFPYVISGEISEPDNLVFYNQQSFAAEKDVDVRLRYTAKSLNRLKKTILCTDGIKSVERELTYDKLVICTGSRMKKYPGLDYSAKNVFEYKHFDDVTRWKKDNDIPADGTVLVLGAGFLGLELADTLQMSGFKVILVDTRPYPPVAGDREAGELLLALIQKFNICYICSENTVFQETGGRVVSARAGGWKMDVDAVFSAVGFEPDTDLAKAAGIKTGEKGGVVVSSRLLTSDDSIYSAGDCIEMTDRITGRKFVGSSAVFAHQTGHTAGANAAGKNFVQLPVIRNTIARVCGKYIGKTGTFDPDVLPFLDSVSNVAWNRSKFLPGAGNVFSKMFFSRQTGAVYGGIFIGGEETAGYCDLTALMIERNMTVREMRDLSFSYSPTISNLIHPISLLGRKAEQKLITRTSL